MGNRQIRIAQPYAQINVYMLNDSKKARNIPNLHVCN